MRFLFTLFGLIIFFHLSAQSDWTKEKSKDGIDIFVRDVPNTPFKEFKGITVLDCTPATLYKVFTDFEGTKKWGYNLAEIDVLKTENPSEYFVYYEIEMPWPLTDRDMVSHIRITTNSQTGEGLMRMEAVKDYIPAKADFVRIDEAVGFYKFEAIAPNQTKLIYQYYADPSGIPAWVVNSFISDSPFVTLSNLKKIVKEDTYK